MCSRCVIAFYFKQRKQSELSRAIWGWTGGYSSPALRAISTAEHFAKAFRMKASDIRQEPGIYEAMPSDLLQIINHIDDKIELAALIGHNPALTSLVSDLSHADLYHIPTCGISLLCFPFDSWKLISAGTGDLAFFDYPKNGD